MADSTKSSGGKMPLRARSALKLVAFFLSGAVGVTAIWGWHPGGKILSALAIFFGSVTLLELRSAKARARSAKSKVGSAHPKPLGAPMIDGYSVVESEGSIWREKLVSIGGRSVTLKLPENEKAFRAVLPYAEKVAREPEVIAAQWSTFKENCLKAPQFAEQRDVLRLLEIETFEFFSPKRPHVAEVILSWTNSDALWTCLFEDNAFRDLAVEN